MSGGYRAELLKLTKRGTTWVLLGVMLALSELFGYILPYTSYATSGENFATEGTTPQQVLASTLPDQLVANALGGFPVFAGALVMIFGALAVGSEYGWGTLKTILTQRPSRLRLLGGKLLALATMVLAAVLILFAVGALSSSLIAAVESKPLDFPAPLDLVEGVAGGWLIMAVWCLLGVLLGFVFRSVALPVGLGVVWILAIESLISGVADSLLTGLRPLRDLLPGTNAGSLVWALTTQAGDPGEVAPGVTDAVTGTRATVTLLLYLALFVAAGATLLRRQDVT